MESEEVCREAPLHAHESGEAASRVTPQRLAMEQLFILREQGHRFGPHRSNALTLSMRIKSKAPLHKTKDRAPKVQLQSPGHPHLPRRPKCGSPIIFLRCGLLH